ncbi:hypothetical protein SELMODRAFT_106927 [Selaginella moellendorffii]|uniref:Uncharacterized protein n=1 Tax=Selaginella moellendorffii TaxID=88036 RepID=D8S1U4_SELML|nr:uncharacterized protein LOC9639174 [Selaginella moellendorffii]EFJ21511.1 hypothetical protein SELMODRAFT_106927 [Selaginella moellendorffii]|eukprot:XP_002977507.1 uncharacterized protein LOC9639174 [Selaginella moellendorffii]
MTTLCLSASTASFRALRARSSLSDGASVSSPARLSPASSAAKSVKLETLSGCKLGIAWYPDFAYNADGGGGSACSVEDLERGRLAVRFDPSSVSIPALSFSTTKLLGLPLPPPLRIEIKPQALEGVIDRHSGKVELRFIAEFFFTAGPVYRAPALVVDTLLTTGSSSGKHRSGQGIAMDENGSCKLVGTAVIDKVSDGFLDAFLALPSECLAEMYARITVT